MERGLDVSYETVRRWVLKFGPPIARKLRQGRPRPSARSHLDEMVVRIAGKRTYLWRRRPRGRGSRHARSASSRYACGTPADAQAAQETGLRAEIAGHRQAGLLRLGFPTARLSGNCASPALAIEASEKTIALKTPIKSCGDESARCSGSSRLDPRSGFSTSIPPSTIPSTINDISSLGRHFGSSEPRQPPSGKMRLPSHETRFDFANSLHLPVSVTKPVRHRGRWRRRLKEWGPQTPTLRAWYATPALPRAYSVPSRAGREYLFTGKCYRRPCFSSLGQYGTADFRGGPVSVLDHITVTRELKAM